MTDTNYLLDYALEHLRGRVIRPFVHVTSEGRVVCYMGDSACDSKGDIDLAAALRAALATRPQPLLLAREAERWRDGPPGDAQPGSEVYDLWLLVGKLAESATPTRSVEMLAGHIPVTEESLKMGDR